MAEDSSQDKFREAFMKAWESGAESWASLLDAPWSPLGQPAGQPGPEPEMSQTGRRAWRLASQGLQAMMAALLDPAVFNLGLQKAGLLPGMGLHLSQAWLEAYQKLQCHWLAKLSAASERTGKMDYQEMEREALRGWEEIYKEEFSRFFQIPKVGLIRFYQERASQYLDKMNFLQAKMAEFLFLLYLPVHKSQLQMQGQIEQDLEAGSLADDFEHYYHLWIKCMEGHYMNLLRSPEYLAAQSETLNAVVEFYDARQGFLQDCLATLPVPTHKDMDALYKELHQLKKEVKALHDKLNE